MLISGSCFEYKKKFGKCNETNRINLSNYFSYYKNLLNKKALLLFQDTPIILIWLRIFYVYGPNQRPNSLIPQIIKSLKEHDNLPDIKFPNNSNDFIYIDDLTKYIEILSKKITKNENY